MPGIAGVGSKYSLINRRNLRFVGILFSVDEKKASLVLKNENRDPINPVLPNETIIETMEFSGLDLLDISPLNESVHDSTSRCLKNVKIKITDYIQSHNPKDKKLLSQQNHLNPPPRSQGFGRRPRIIVRDSSRSTFIRKIILIFDKINNDIDKVVDKMNEISFEKSLSEPFEQKVSSNLSESFFDDLSYDSKGRNFSSRGRKGRGYHRFHGSSHRNNRSHSRGRRG